MYCRKCGKEIADTDKFCSACGMDTKEQIKPAQLNLADSEAFNTAVAAASSAAKTLSSKGIYTVSSIAASALFIILLFMKWLEVPVLRYISSLFGGSSGTGSYSILKLVMSLKGIATNDYLNGSSRIVMVLLILALTVFLLLSVYFLGKYIYDFLSKKEKNTGEFRAGLNGIIILFVVCFIGMLIINSTVSDKTYGIYSQALSLTGVAYFTGIAAILAKFILVKKLEEEIKSRK